MNVVSVNNGYRMDSSIVSRAMKLIHFLSSEGIQASFQLLNWTCYRSKKVGIIRFIYFSNFIHKY